jgi:hypothetical protein
MRNRTMVILIALSAAGWVACSNSTGPAPTMAGTWHVVTGTMSAGSLNPTIFDVVITASKDTFVAAVPSITYSVGPVTFDSAVSMFVYNDSQVVISAQVGGSPHVCDYIAISGTFNAARDTLKHGQISVGDTDATMAYVCKPKSQGSVTATK